MKGGLCPPFFSAYHATIMRLFIAIFFLLSASVSFAAGITSKTADFVIYKNSLGSSTIPIPNWELVVDGDSLAGKKSLPVPKSNTSFNATLPLPRGKLLSNLGKLARLNPYLFIAQGLIDLYYDEATQQFMTRRNPSGDCSGNEIAGFVQQCFPGVFVTDVIQYNVYSASVGFFYPSGVFDSVDVNLICPGPDCRTHVSVGQSCVYPYGSGDIYTDSFGTGQSCGDPDNRKPVPQPQLEPATETEIAQNLDKNLTPGKLPAVRDLVKSQNWTLETDTTPTVSGPPEVVISTQTKTVQNPDGTTTTQKIVEKAVYTYNNNVITENYVTQVFHGDQLVENNVTEISNETSTEPVDYTFQPPSGEYPTDLEIPEKRDLVADVLNPVASQLQGFGSKIGLRGSGQCSFDIPFSLGRASGSGRLDFCQYQSTFSTVGSMLVAFAYLMAGLIVLGMRH